MPNLKKLAKPYEKKAIDALKVFVSKKSVYDPSSIEEGAPYGKGVKSALDYLAKLGKDFGFAVDTCDGYVTEISCGEEGPIIGVYGHADVVPATGKWSTKDPFKAEIVGEKKDAKMIARGTSDDKGPLLAAFYAMKLLKDNGLVKGYRIRLCAGGDEERGSSCLKHYFEDMHKEHCALGFTPDADFPLIYAEKGMVKRCFLKKQVDLSPIIGMDGGVVSNAVNDKLVVTLPLDEKFSQAFADAKIDGEVRKETGFMIAIFRGKTAHGSTPELGKNAALSAFSFLGSYYHIDFLSNLAKALSDPSGKSFGGDSLSPELGKSTFNYGIVSYESNRKNLSISVDYRYGEKADPEAALNALQDASKMDAHCEGFVAPLLYDKKSPLVSTLMKSYRHMTHRLFDKPMAIGGGTYAKEAKNCVAYGSAFKGHPGDIHSPNEYIYIEDFLKQIPIYADAIASLGKVASK